MKFNTNLKTTGQAIQELNKDVYGKDPNNEVLTLPYNSTQPIQERLELLEETAAGLLVTKYIGPINVAALGVPQALPGAAAIDLLDAMLFANQHPNDKKGIGLIAVVPAALINDPTNFPNNTDITYTVTLTVFAGQIDTSGHTKVLLQGDSPEYKFEISCTINFAAGSYVVAPTLSMFRISIDASNVLTNGGTLDVTLLLKADATNKATILGSGTMTDITNEVTDPRLIAPKVIKDYAEPKITDTGWQALSLLNDATGTVYIRRYGNMVFLKVDVVFDDNYSVPFCNIPVGYRPTTIPAFLTLSTDNTIGRVFISDVVWTTSSLKNKTVNYLFLSWIVG